MADQIIYVVNGIAASICAVMLFTGIGVMLIAEYGGKAKKNLHGLTVKVESVE